MPAYPRIHSLLVVFLTSPFYSYFDDVVSILLKLWHEECLYSEEMVTKTPSELQNYINEYDVESVNVGTTLHEVAIAIRALDNALVPQNPKELKSALGHCTDETVRALLMQDVFGYTDLVVGMHARKMAVALDLFDWEEYAAKKTDVKMVNITTAAVKKSFKTWLPKGEIGNFHTVMDDLGELLSRDARGDNGKVMRTINRHFSTEEKKELSKYVLDITRFYKAVKKRNVVKHQN